MIKQYLTIILSVIFFVSCKKAEIGNTTDCTNSTNPNPLHPKASTLQNLVDKYIKKGLPGISLMIKNSDGTWVTSAGYASLEDRILYKPCHVGKVGSITKFMIGVLVFKLMEDSVNTHIGYADFDKPLSNWIDKDILKNIENAENATLRQCLNHSTGIFDIITDSEFYLSVLNNPNKRWTQEELLKFVYGRKAAFQLGTSSGYSNTNTILASMVIEKSTGKKHLELLREKLWKPLGMNDTYYQGREDLPPFVTQGYFDLYNKKQLTNVSNILPGSGNAFNGVFSNVYDHQKLIEGVLIDKTVLSNKSLAMMQSFGPPDGINNYGVGIMKKFNDRGNNYGLGHSGRDLGYTADLFWFPNKNFTINLFINYGTDSESFLKPIFYEFEAELIDEMLK
ncbi:MAG: beta-lactamase family protein [Bacteroidia bacterium]|nr:beta-lactamase family protein [Bacteroidia bacterium]